MNRGPILINLEEDAPVARPEAAPAVPDVIGHDNASSMQQVAALAARKPSKLARWFWSLTLGLLTFIASLAAWDYVTSLIARSAVLGGIAAGLIALLCSLFLLIALRELAAFGQLRRLDRVQRQATAALENADLEAARGVLDVLNGLYARREDTAWGRKELAERRGDILDADGLLGLAETALVAPLDARAMREVEAAARQVATVTAIVPLALADLFAALTANLRMIRRIAEIYGGRAGTLGSWRLTRTVLTHLVATGAVAVGDDLIGSVAGGGLLSKVSRRFGEGIINGALTARVGVAAIEVCRPLPFHVETRPSVTALVRRALTGLFSGGD